MMRAGRLAILVAGLLAVLGLVSLGTWQVHRLAWKRALIASVDARIHAPPVAAPVRAEPSDAYLRIAAIGCYLPGRDTFVQASTVRGPGYWTMTPLRTERGDILLVNRGYVPQRHAALPPAGPQRIVGLLRLSEPGGGFLRSNVPAADRWYSRDVAAIAARRGLADVRTYFLDAGASPDANQPVGGLTVVAFPNNHLAYAITWFILAAMTAIALAYWLRTTPSGTPDA